MAKVYLDTNVVIDLVEHRGTVTFDQLNENRIYFSPLSIHILSYIYKYKMPNSNLMNSLGTINAVSLDQNIMKKATEGPTIDFEDNVQLHSAAEAECEYFLTSDKKLLDMKFFGKTKIDKDLTQV